MDEIRKIECALNVSVRIRPEKPTDKNIVVLNENDDKFLAVGDKPYLFDKIFSPTTTQEAMYLETVKPFVQKLFQGYSCTVLAYGQTGTGKTYTMLGKNSKSYENSDSGLVSRTINDVFKYATESSLSNVTIEISFIEIYNQKIFDLICRQRDEKSKWVVKNSKIDPPVFQEVSMATEALALLDFGIKRRHVGATNMNASSSRSHSIFTIKCIIQNEGSYQVSKLNLVDLGGSESIKRTGNEGIARLEGIYINQSLFALRQVLNALSKNDKLIPFRDSLLTTVLHDSLTLKSYNILIACISPDVNDYSESVNTLRFAESTKEIKSKPEVEVIMNTFKVQNPMLFAKPAEILTTMNPTPLKQKFNNTIGTPGHKVPKVNLLSKVNHSYNTPRDPKSYLSRRGERKFDFDSNLFDELADIANLSSSTILEDVIEPPKKRNKPISYSPIVKKCTEAIENKLESIISKQLGLFFEKTQQNNFKKDTPAVTSTPESARRTRLSNIMNIMESRIHGIVEQSLKKIRHQETNSCVPKRTLKFPSSSPKPDFDFKVPESSPPKLSERRSKRLSQRLGEITDTSTKIRRSVRLSQRFNMTELLNETPKISKRGQNETTFSNTEVRSKRNVKPTKRYSPSTYQEKNNKSKLSNHQNKILHILNNGSEKTLMELVTVGQKTANQIITYRSLYGQFKTISMLQDVPFWTKKQSDKFLAANCCFQYEKKSSSKGSK